MFDMACKKKKFWKNCRNTCDKCEDGDAICIDKSNTCIDDIEKVACKKKKQNERQKTDTHTSRQRE